MKILLVNYRYFISGGPERYLFNVKKALEEMGHQVIPFSIKTSQNVETKYSKYFADNIGKSSEVFIDKYPKTLRTYCDLVSREFYSWSVKRKLKKLIKDTQPDICYLLAYKRALSPSVIDACYEMGIPIVNRISDYNMVCGAASLYHNGNFCTKCFNDNDKSCINNKCIKGSILFSFIRYSSMRLFRTLKYDEKINAYICTNGFMSKMMQERGYDEKKINVIPTFYKTQERYRAINKNNIVGNVTRFLYIGNIDESKGIYDLIDALEIISKQIETFHLTIVGGLHKEENEKMLFLFKKKGLEKYVTFQPFQNDGDIFEYYLKCNVTILPARWPENLPNTLVESLYFNRPVVVPQWGSFKYTTNENVAFYYQALSSSSLAEVLNDIICNPGKIQDKSLACQQFFAQNYDEDSHMKNLLSLFQSVITEQHELS